MFHLLFIIVTVFVQFIDIWLAGETYHNADYLREVAEREKNKRFQAYHDEDIFGNETATETESS